MTINPTVEARKTKPIKPNLIVQSYGFVIPVETGIQPFGGLWIPHQVRNDRSEAIFEKEQLKKQSQFTPSQIGVISYVKGAYGNTPPCGAQKTKPIQSQLRISMDGCICD